MLPLFFEDSKFIAMIIHAMRIIKQTTAFINPNQTPVAALDQPFYASAKNNQWTEPDEFGENIYFLMLGGLHIEIVHLLTACALYILIKQC